MRGEVRVARELFPLEGFCLYARYEYGVLGAAPFPARISTS